MGIINFEDNFVARESMEYTSNFGMFEIIKSVYINIGSITT